MFLEGKTALVTGGGRGIGRAVAERLAREGARVVVAARSVEEIQRVAESIGGIPLTLDLESRDATEREVTALVDRIGPIHVLVNNAGIAESAPFEKTSFETWDRSFAINVTAPFLLVKLLVPKMIEAGFGRVVNVASNAGLTGYAYTSAYCASKHALVGLTRAVALEIGRSPVTINAVCPGWVKTEMADRAAQNIAKTTGRSEADAEKILSGMSPQKRMVAPEEVAHAVAMLCAPEARGIHGQTIGIDGGQVMK